jgi:hypothetical protein
LETVTTGFATVTTGLSYRNCNLARPLRRHLRLHCTKFNDISEDTAVGLVFEYDARIDGPGDFQDGTSSRAPSPAEAPAG